MTKDEAFKIAKPIIRAVVDLISDEKYESITDHADFGEEMSAEILKAAIEEFMSDADISHIDKYDETFLNPHYDDCQFSVLFYRDGTGFYADYDFMTDGETNDLTLQMEFVFTGDQGIKAYIEDCHVL